MLKDRLNPLFVEQFQKNPYTQSLQSYIVPYNPAFPQKQSKQPHKFKVGNQVNRRP